MHHLALPETHNHLHQCGSFPHTSELLHTLPVSRKYLYGWKYVALLWLIVAFNGICIVFDLAGFWCVGEDMLWKEYWMYHGMSLLMQVEIGSICFLLSAMNKQKQLGPALGLAVLLYLMELMVHIVPDLEFLEYITPYYYANAANLFSGGDIPWIPAGIGLAVCVLTVMAGKILYQQRDIAA